MSTLKVDKSNYEQLKNGNKTVLIDFYADWCGPCRMMAPILEEIANEYPQIVVGKVNVDDEPELAQEFQVTSIPTLVVLENGSECARSVGARPKAQVVAMLNR